MNHPCPICQAPLRIWFDLTDYEAHCQCVNPACNARHIEAAGNTTKEAVEVFVGKANGFEIRQRKL